MLRIGLTGGIGAGKSTVSATFNDCGGIIVDGDVIAREVVEPGTEGLAQLVEAFGEDILLPDGALNRPALAAKAFVDDEQRAKLNGIVHPLVGQSAPGDHRIGVRRRRGGGGHPAARRDRDGADVPARGGGDRRHRNSSDAGRPERGMDEADARARIAAQAPEEQRRAIADVLLDNSGSHDELVAQARDVWFQRVLPLAHNIRNRRAVQYPWKLVPYNPEWPEQAQRIVNRLQTACGPKVLRVDHIGSTAVPGLDAKDVVDIQLTVASLDVADDLVGALADVGYPRIEHITGDTPHTDDPALWQKRIHGAADPGRPVNVHVRVDGWPGQQFALLFRDWLKANPGVQSEYVAVKRKAQEAQDYPEAKEPWFDDAYVRAWEWADSTGWRP